MSELSQSPTKCTSLLLSHQSWPEDVNTAQDDFVTVTLLVNDIEAVMVLNYLSLCGLWRTRTKTQCTVLACGHRQFLAFFSVACEKTGQCWTTPLKRCQALNQSLFTHMIPPTWFLYYHTDKLWLIHSEKIFRCISRPLKVLDESWRLLESTYTKFQWSWFSEQRTSFFPKYSRKNIEPNVLAVRLESVKPSQHS